MTATFPAPSMSTTTLAADQYPAAVAAGALVVDIRSHAQRERQGVLAGSVAVAARPVVEFLDPSSGVALASATAGRQVVLVSDDGFDAELFAWELQNRGVRAVRAVDGGHDALRSVGALGLLTDSEHLLRERSAIAAH